MVAMLTSSRVEETLANPSGETSPPIAMERMESGSGAGSSSERGVSDDAVVLEVRSLGDPVDGESAAVAETAGVGPQAVGSFLSSCRPRIRGRATVGCSVAQTAARRGWRGWRGWCSWCRGGGSRWPVEPPMPLR